MKRRLLSYEDMPIVPPPATLTVESPRPILFRADGTPLQRKVGFSMQTSQTFPELTTKTKKTKSGKKKTY